MTLSHSQPRLVLRLVASACAFAATGNAFSQTTLANVALKDVVVTATRVASPLSEVSADVSVIQRADLEQAGQSSLRDLLGQLPGVQMVANGSYRSSTSLFLRGATSSQSVVLVDGVRVGSATSGGAALDNIPLDRIERVEVLRGAASALYGPDAVGGVIQIFTRVPADGLAVSVSGGLGTDGQEKAAASLQGRSGLWGYSLGASRERATGISVQNNPAVGGYNPDSDGFVTNSLDAKLTAQINREHGLSLAALRSEADYQFDGTPSPNPLALTKSTSDAHAKPMLDNLSFQWDAQWSGHWKSTLTLGSSEDRSISDYYRQADGAFGGNSRFNTRRRQTSWQNDITLGDGKAGSDVISVALETRQESVDSSTPYTVSQRDISSALLSYALNQADWNALLVARNDDNSQFGSVNNWAVSGGYKLSSQWRAVASMGTSFQAPTFNQLYFPGFGNTALQPQRNRAQELGLRYQTRGLNLGAVVYQNDVRGFINPTTNVQSALAVLKGVTLTADYRSGDTSLSASFDYADPRSSSATPSQDGLRLVRIAQQMFNARARHQWNEFSVYGELKVSSDREDNNLAFTGRDTLAGYTLLNLGAEWRVSRNTTLQARVNNVTDANYSLANGYSTPGRNVFVSLAWAL
ncbi:MAG: hypothetical protein CFE44_04615 [Burkholderiales bacterium PBB4]|nr:MAG: hypothetical protein CFE44_04615 [Burkholderiales bacterium PBB4]